MVALTAGLLIAGAVAVMATIASIGFFFGEITFFVIIAGIAYAYATGNINVERVTPILGLALVAPILFNVFGLSVMMPSLQLMEPQSADPGNYPAIQGDIQVDQKGQMLASSGSTTVAPGTYRPVELTLKNEDSLPLVLDGTMMYGFAGDCQDKNIVESARKLLNDDFNPCSVQQGETVEIRSGSIDGLVEFGSKVSETNNFGVTSEIPDDMKEEGTGKDLLDQYANDWKARTAMVYADVNGFEGGETALLWDQQKCREKALDNVDCSRANKKITLDDSMYVWADQKVETPKSKTLTVVFLTPAKDDVESKLLNAVGVVGQAGTGALAGSWAGGPIGAVAGGLGAMTIDDLRVIEEHDYRVTAVLKKDIQFMSPEVKASLALGGIGILAILGVFYRRKLPIPA